MSTQNNQWDNYGIPPLTRADRLLLQQVYRSNSFAQPTKKIDDKKPLPPNYFDRYIAGTKSDYRLDYMITERSVWGNILRSYDTPESQYDFKDFLDRSGLRGVTEQSAAQSIRDGVMPSSYALQALSAGSLSGLLSFHKNEHLTYMRRMLTLSYQQARTQVEISSTLKSIGILLEKTSSSNGGFGDTMMSRISEAFKRQTAAAIATSLRELSSKGIGWAGKKVIDFLDLKALLDGRFSTKLVANRLNYAIGGGLQGLAGASNWLYGLTGFKPLRWTYKDLHSNKYAISNWLTKGSEKLYQNLDSKINQIGKLYHFGKHTVPGKAILTIANTLSRDYKSQFTEGMDGSFIRTDDSIRSGIHGGVKDYEKKSLFYAEAQSNYLRDIRDLIASGYGVGGNGSGFGLFSKKKLTSFNLPEYSNVDFYNSKVKEQQDTQEAIDKNREEVLKERFERLKEEHPFDYGEKFDNTLKQMDTWWKGRKDYLSGLNWKGKGFRGLFENETKSRKLMDIGWKSVLGGGLLALSGLPFVGMLPLALAYNTYMTGLHRESDISNINNRHLRVGRAMANLAINFSMLPKMLALPYSAFVGWRAFTNKQKIDRVSDWIEHLALNWGMGDILPVQGSKALKNLFGLGLISALSKRHGNKFNRLKGFSEEIQSNITNLDKYEEENKKYEEELKKFEGREIKSLSKKEKKRKEYLQALLKHNQNKIKSARQDLSDNTFYDKDKNKKLIQRTLDQWEYGNKQIGFIDEKLSEPSLSQEERDKLNSERQQLLVKQAMSQSSYDYLKNYLESGASLDGNMFSLLVQDNPLLKNFILEKQAATIKKMEKFNSKKATEEFKEAYKEVKRVRKKKKDFLKGKRETNLTPEEKVIYEKIEKELETAHNKHWAASQKSNMNWITGLFHGYPELFFENRKRAKIQSKADSLFNQFGILTNDHQAILEEQKQLKDESILKDPEAQTDILSRLTAANAVQIKKAHSTLDKFKDLEKSATWKKLSSSQRHELHKQVQNLQQLLPTWEANFKEHNERLKELDKQKPYATEQTTMLSSFFKNTRPNLSKEGEDIVNETGHSVISPSFTKKANKLEIYANVVNLYGKYQKGKKGLDITGLGDNAKSDKAASNDNDDVSSKPKYDPFDTSKVTGEKSSSSHQKLYQFTNQIPKNQGAGPVNDDNLNAANEQNTYNPFDTSKVTGESVLKEGLGVALGEKMKEEFEGKPQTTSPEAQRLVNELKQKYGIAPEVPESSHKPHTNLDEDINEAARRGVELGMSHEEEVFRPRTRRERILKALRKGAHGETGFQSTLAKWGNRGMIASLPMGAAGIGAMTSEHPLLGTAMLSGSLASGLGGLALRALANPMLATRLGLAGASLYELGSDVWNYKSPHKHRLWNSLKQMALLGATGAAMGGPWGALIGAGLGLLGANSDVIASGFSHLGHGFMHYGVSPVGHIFKGIYHFGKGIGEGVWNANKGWIYGLGRGVRDTGDYIGNKLVNAKDGIENKVDYVGNAIASHVIDPIGHGIYKHVWNHSLGQEAFNKAESTFSSIKHGFENFDAEKAGEWLGKHVTPMNLALLGATTLFPEFRALSFLSKTKKARKIIGTLGIGSLLGKELGGLFEPTKAHASELTPEMIKNQKEEEGTIFFSNEQTHDPKIKKYIEDYQKQGATVKTVKGGIDLILPKGKPGPAVSSVLKLHNAAQAITTLVYGKDAHDPTKLKKLDKQIDAISKTQSGVAGALVKADTAAKQTKGGGFWNKFKSVLSDAFNVLENGGSSSNGPGDSLGANANVKAGPAIPITSAQQKKNVMSGMKFLLSKGFCLNACAAILGNFQGESGLNPYAVGDNGVAYGIAQWHPNRQSKIAQHFGKTLGGMTFVQQLNAALWEMSTSYKECWNALRTKGQTLRYYVWYLVNKYEMPELREPNVIKRTEYAEGVLAYYKSQTAANDDKKSGSAVSNLVNDKLKDPHKGESSPSGGSSGSGLVASGKGMKVPNKPVSAGMMSVAGGTGSIAPSALVRHSLGLSTTPPPLTVSQTTHAVTQAMTKTNKVLSDIHTSNKTQIEHLSTINTNTAYLKDISENIATIAQNSKQSQNVTINKGGTTIINHHTSNTNTLSLKRVGSTTGIG